MICQPCADEADYVARINDLEPTHPQPLPQAHDPAICRDASIAGHGCTCQHGAEATR
jgi:hypothetical protein